LTDVLLDWHGSGEFTGVPSDGLAHHGLRCGRTVPPVGRQLYRSFTWRTELRRIRSTAIAVLASTALAFALTGCQVDGTDQGDVQDVLIAADLELSGAMAQVGTAYLRALELRVEQVNRSGEMGDRRLRLKARDNRSDPSESLRNVDRFTADPSVAAIILGS
jgi:ABC-type branched-subunit amino acid transport system substrate-binding protein